MSGINECNRLFTTSFVKWAIFEIVGVIEVAENKEMKSAFGSSGYRASDLQTTHRNAGKSPEITDQDDVAAFAASCQRQLPAVTRPVKVENQSRLKIRDLFRRSAC